MANVFMVEWDNIEEQPPQKVRNKVEFGNFDGNVAKAQQVLDQSWPHNYAGRRANWKVLSIVGAGEVTRVSIPRGSGDNSAARWNTTINEAPAETPVVKK